MRITMCRELFVRSGQEIGTGGRLFSKLLALGINVVAFSGWTAEQEARFCIIVDGDEKSAQQALEAEGYIVLQRTALSIDLANRPGSLVALLKTLADNNLDVAYSYATSTQHNRTRVVLQTSDNEMARHLISTIPGRA